MLLGETYYDNIMWHLNDLLKGYGIRSFIPIFRRGKGDREVEWWSQSHILKTENRSHAPSSYDLLVASHEIKKNANIFPWPVRLCLIRSLLFLPNLIFFQSLPRWKHSSCLVSPQFLKFYHRTFSYLTTIVQIVLSDWNSLPHCFCLFVCFVELVPSQPLRLDLNITTSETVFTDHTFKQYFHVIFSWHVAFYFRAFMS